MRGIQSAPFLTRSSGSWLMVYESVRLLQGWNVYWRSCISLPVDVARPNSVNGPGTLIRCVETWSPQSSVYTVFFKQLPGREPTYTDINIMSEEENPCPSTRSRRLLSGSRLISVHEILTGGSRTKAIGERVH